MTHITKISKRFRVKVTDRTNELAEKIGVNIAGEEFKADEGWSGKGFVRGYVMIPLFGMVRQNYGPVVLSAEDLEKEL